MPHSKQETRKDAQPRREGLDAAPYRTGCLSFRRGRRCPSPPRLASPYHVAFQTNDWAPPDRMTGQWEVEARKDDRGGEKQKEKFLRKSKRTQDLNPGSSAPGLSLSRHGYDAMVQDGFPLGVTLRRAVVADEPVPVASSLPEAKDSGWIKRIKKLVALLRGQQPGVEFKPPISTELTRGIADGLVVLVPRKPRGVMRLGTWGLGSIPRLRAAAAEGPEPGHATPHAARLALNWHLPTLAAAQRRSVKRNSIPSLHDVLQSRNGLLGSTWRVPGDQGVAPERRLLAAPLRNSHSTLMRSSTTTGAILAAACACACACLLAQAPGATAARHTADDLLYRPQHANVVRRRAAGNKPDDAMSPAFTLRQSHLRRTRDTDPAVMAHGSGVKDK
ncbi:Phosphate import ATP-binding protein PstB 2 [Frankliniella fusca]|uniref:Phosphate import ATP-binding protein PstB 2 n=1 Tax=Frankliniella fusca TaxID=407009 RepID=A0AAE1H045_9NEOP|nr:Phosphate import ATP-binding protein PstB 2 [Frankliniella fusca]